MAPRSASLDVADDVLLAVKERARRESGSVGDGLSDLARPKRRVRVRGSPPPGPPQSRTSTAAVTWTSFLSFSLTKWSGIVDVCVNNVLARDTKRQLRVPEEPFEKG
jgi:hypothetical protein